jgi:hypothetical protein
MNHDLKALAERAKNGVAPERQINHHAIQPEPCALADVGEVKPCGVPELLEDCDSYFGDFAKPVRGSYRGQSNWLHHLTPRTGD